MPTHTITVCDSCGKRTCDGGIWRIVSCIEFETGIECVKSVHPDNLDSCSLSRLGVKLANKYRNAQIGTIVSVERYNWSKPSLVKYEKIEE